jgi:hypothetical protein
LTGVEAGAASTPLGAFTALAALGLARLGAGFFRCLVTSPRSPGSPRTPRPPGARADYNNPGFLETALGGFSQPAVRLWRLHLRVPDEDEGVGHERNGLGVVAAGGQP